MRKFFQMAAIFFILLSTPVQACADHVFLSEYKQTLFNLGSGLGADEANDVLQTADGYVGRLLQRPPALRLHRFPAFCRRAQRFRGQERHHPL